MNAQERPEGELTTMPRRNDPGRRERRMMAAAQRQHDTIVRQNTRRAEGHRLYFTPTPVSYFVPAGSTFCPGNHTADLDCDGDPVEAAHRPPANVRVRPPMTCDVCGLPDLHRGQGDGIGSCDCPRCDCGEARSSALCTCPPDDQWDEDCPCDGSLICRCYDDGPPWPDDVYIRPTEDVTR